ncbi:oxidoreductase aldo/keto reductase family [Lactiplantibacillus plantarum]|nr:oxidoreductase aldo/keto reductase family [Lactiplantibacillus plantarum]
MQPALLRILNIDFELTQDEMQQMTKLDEGTSLFGNMHDPETVAQLGGFKFDY